MASETLPAKRLENALTKLQDAQSALRLAVEELAIVDSEMIGSDAHRRLIVESSADDPIKTAQDLGEDSFFGLLARAFARFFVLAQEEIYQADCDSVPAYQIDTDGNPRSRCSRCGLKLSSTGSPMFRLPLEASATSDDELSVGPRVASYPSAPSDDAPTQIPVVLGDAEMPQSQADRLRP